VLDKGNTIVIAHTYYYITVNEGWCVWRME